MPPLIGIVSDPGRNRKKGFGCGLGICLPCRRVRASSWSFIGSTGAVWFKIKMLDRLKEGN